MVCIVLKKTRVLLHYSFIIKAGHKSILPGTNALASPTSSEAGKSSSSAFHLPPSRGSGEYDSTSSIASSTTTSERRQSLVMSGGPRIASPRHHPYNMSSPGKVYTPSIMSTLQSYRTSSEYNKDDLDNNNTTATTNDLNRHPW
jgi:hypothetical protein